MVEPAANFIYFDTHRDAKAVAQKLAERKILIGAPSTFNRVTVGREDQNAAFLAAMKEVLAELPVRP